MENEFISGEVIEMTEEIATAGPSKGWKVVTGVALTALVGTCIYKFAVKPIAKKIKAKKAQRAVESDVEYADGEVVDVNED